MSLPIRKNFYIREIDISNPLVINELQIDDKTCSFYKTLPDDKEVKTSKFFDGDLSPDEDEYLVRFKTLSGVKYKEVIKSEKIVNNLRFITITIESDSGNDEFRSKDFNFSSFSL